MNWPSQVRKDFAKQDGLTPEDFQYGKWPVSNARIEFPPYGTPRSQMLAYRCDMAARHAAPQPVRGRRHPGAGPEGHRPRLGPAQAPGRRQPRHPGRGPAGPRRWEGARVAGDVSPLWHRLKPGKMLQVKLVAVPEFFYLDENGGGNLSYCTNPNGYFHGEEVESQVLHAVHDRGRRVPARRAGRAAAPEAPPAEYTAEELELQAGDGARAPAGRARAREEHERMAKQQAEIDAARDIIYSRRHEDDSDEAWLFGVLADKTLDFGTVRKYVYRVADEVGFDFRGGPQAPERCRCGYGGQAQGRVRRQAGQAGCGRRHPDGRGRLRLLRSSSVEEKLDVLRKLRDDERFAKYRTAIEAVASKLGVTL